MVSQARATLGLAALLSVGFLAASYSDMRSRVLADRTLTSFFGAFNGWDAPEATVGEGPERRFPLMLRGPGHARGPHSLRLVFQAEEGQGIHLGVVQFDGPKQQPARLAVQLNGGPAVAVATTAGTGRDPRTVEHGVTSQYDVVLPGLSRCGRNEILIRGESGDWTALSRLDVTSPAPVDASRWRGILGAGALLAWGAYAASALRRRPRWGPALGQAALLVLGLALGLAFAEAALRAFGGRLGKVKLLLFSPGDAEKMEATADVLADLRGHRCGQEPCTLQDCGFLLNRNGFHTGNYEREKKKGVTRVLGLGDSFMFYSGPVPHESELLPRVEADARRAAPAREFEFINLGFPCVGLVTQRAILEGEGLPLAPDAIVWTLYLGNDVTDETDGWKPPPRVRGGPPSLDGWPGRSLLFRFVSRLGWLAARDPDLLFARCAATPQAARASCGELARRETPYDPEQKTMTDDEYRSYALTRIATLYRPEQKAYVRPLLELFAQRLADIQARLVGVPTLFVLIPDELQVSPQELGRVLAWEPAWAAAPPLDLDYMTAHLQQTLPRAGLDVLDLTPAFKEEMARGKRLYQPNDGHLNTNGTALAGRLIGDALRKRGVY